MRNNHFLDVIYTHTEGEPTCIVHSGIPYPFGTDILGKRDFLEANLDYVRTSLMREPRGHQDMFGVFLTPPSGPDTDAGMLWMDGERFVEMCGHGTIALSMAMVAHNMVLPDPSGLTRIRFETPAGLVVSEVQSEGNDVLWTRFENVPAFVLEQDVPIDLPGYKGLTADIVFGGNFFAIIKVPSEQRKICPENGSAFSELGQMAKDQINQIIDVRHPTQSHISKVHFTTFWHEGDEPDSLYRNVHVFSNGKLDRSPGGTGTSAMMAMFHARGKLGLNQKIFSEGLLGSGRFQGELVGETKVGDVNAVRPTVKGTAQIVGYAKWLLDPKDPVGRGFVIR